MGPDRRADLSPIPRSDLIAPPRAGVADAGHPPLSLYIHIPWCLKKCPYCDFASRPLTGTIPETAYCAALLADLTEEIERLAQPRPVTSIFFGGGTPSLLSGALIERLMAGIRDRIALASDAEVTLEANPGAADAGRFAAYSAAGVNRLSIGVQSLSVRQLRRLGRIHDPDQARNAVTAARAAGFKNINLDLMYGLPTQTAEECEADITTALAMAPEHLSYYQLTLEPGTPLYLDRPPLPNEDLIAERHADAVARLAAAGYTQYETSAFALPGRRCRHNLNYWEFGDYLGIGAGAHGKLSIRLPGRVERRVKHTNPDEYLAAIRTGDFIESQERLSEADLALDFLINALRLHEGFPVELFERRTGLARARLIQQLERARRRGFLILDAGHIRPTALGQRFQDDLLVLLVECHS